jgi:hypothetical protein
MKNKSKMHSWVHSVITCLAMAASGSLCYGASDIIIGPQGTEASISNPDGTWQNMWGPAHLGTAWDPATPPPSGDTLGSVYNYGDWTGDTGPNGMDNYNIASPGNWWGAVTFDGSQYTSIELDIKYDTTSTMTPTSAAHLGIGFDSGYNFHQIINESFDTASSPLADGAWHHLSIPISPTTSGISAVNSVSYYQWNPAGTSGTMSFWMANVKVIARIVPVAPPTMSIKTVTPGLNFVEGSISGEYDRQNIRTVNSTAASPINYSWVGTATPGTPVTYSFNISKWSATDLSYHIFITPAVGGESAPDYNETNVFDFQIGPVSGVGTVANIFWKTNLPSAGTDHTAITITNQSLLGLWQLQFTSDTAGAIIAPDSTSYPFVVDSGLAAALANPVYITFGINPGSAANTVLGESVVVSQIGITGAGSLSSVATVYTDNFLDDSVLNTNIWAVNAHYAPSIWFVPTNTAYSVDWTLPDSGFSLIQSPSLLSLGTGTPVQFPVVLLTPGARELIPSSSLPAGNSGFFALIKRIYTQLQILLPGETAAPNTVSGKTGTPIAQTANTGFNVIVNAVDNNWNVVNSAPDTISLYDADGNFFVLNTPTLLALSGGTATFSVEFTGDGSSAITATDVTNTNIPPATSSTVTY